MVEFRFNLTITEHDYYIDIINNYDLTTQEEEIILNYSEDHYYYLDLLKVVILEKRGLGRVENIVPFVSNLIQEGGTGYFNHYPYLEKYWKLSPNKEKLLNLLFEEVKKNPFILTDSYYNKKKEGTIYCSNFELIHRILLSRYKFFKKQERDNVQREILEILKYSPGSAEYLKAKNHFILGLS